MNFVNLMHFNYFMSENKRLKLRLVDIYIIYVYTYFLRYSSIQFSLPASSIVLSRYQVSLKIEKTFGLNPLVPSYHLMSEV